ncbi:hypothetical protein D779_3670 [Imhoffiella purpurea]|uniref:Uncharacterized protein n=2 Tax=Imhoffiella purpurea TaxID=1249627 RepID=W9VT03_9GAMM|nr:hypothetical protein D779_3670 [Imhoffiella purpurea]
MGQAVNQTLREEMQRDSRLFLAGEGVDVEIVDLRTLTPLDTETIVAPNRARRSRPIRYTSDRCPLVGVRRK